MSFLVRVNNQNYTLLETASLKRSIENFSGAYTITTSSTERRPYPIKKGDLVEILINGVVKARGYIDSISSSMGKDSHTVTVSGRDNIQDLIDSSVPDDVKSFTGPISLETICQSVVDALGLDINVINQVDGLAEFQSDELQSASSGQKCMEFLYSFARKRQVYLVSSGTGNLLIYRPQQVQSSSDIIHRIDGQLNNVIAYEFNSSDEDRYNSYNCKSQNNYSTLFADPAVGANVTNTATDEEIRAGRYIEFQAEESMNASECGNRASEESNLRRAKGFEYSCVVYDFAQADGTVWDYGQLVNVYDDFANISGVFMITAVEYLFDINSGSRTNITVASPDAYQVLASLTLTDKKKSLQAPNFNETEQNLLPVDEPPTVEVISLYSEEMTTILNLARELGG